MSSSKSQDTDVVLAHGLEMLRIASAGPRSYLEFVRNYLFELRSQLAQQADDAHQQNRYQELLDISGLVEADIDEAQAAYPLIVHRRWSTAVTLGSYWGTGTMRGLAYGAT